MKLREEGDAFIADRNKLVTNKITHVHERGEGGGRAGKGGDSAIQAASPEVRKGFITINEEGGLSQLTSQRGGKTQKKKNP